MTGGVVQARFASALRDPFAPVPTDLAPSHGRAPERRFAVYRNNVAVSLRVALESRFPACRRIVGEAFFAELAQAYVGAHPPRSPLMMTYGDGLPAFMAGVEALAGLPYLPDVARIEAARTRAYHAADAEPLRLEAFAAVSTDALERLRVTLHPSLEIVRSAHPAVTIWAMNADELPLAPLADWRPEDALVARPAMDVTVRALPAGGAAFLAALAGGAALATAVAAGAKADSAFDLTLNLQGLVEAGLTVALSTDEPRRGGRRP